MFKQKLSGQSVAVLPGWTLKWGPGAKAQGDHMYRVECTPGISHLTPKIYMAFGNVYVMETLAGIDKYHWRTAASRLEPLWAMSEKVLLPNVLPFDTRALVSFLGEYDAPKVFGPPPMQLIGIVYKNCDEATHGDPTEQNTKRRRDDYVFIDWQWHRRQFLPAHRDVDYGKLLQSIIIKEETWNGLELLHVAPAAWFWCCVHFMRIAKRDPTRKSWCDRQIEKCVWLHNRRKTNNVV